MLGIRTIGEERSSRALRRALAALEGRERASPKGESDTYIDIADSPVRGCRRQGADVDVEVK